MQVLNKQKGSISTEVLVRLIILGANFTFILFCNQLYFFKSKKKRNKDCVYENSTPNNSPERSLPSNLSILPPESIPVNPPSLIKVTGSLITKGVIPDGI